MPITKVTVCELPNDFSVFEHVWDRLVAHVRQERSDLVLLPEMPFHPWLPHTRTFNEASWIAAVEAHQHWMQRLPELESVVVGTHPVTLQNKRLNVGYIVEPGHEPRVVHSKYYLPDETGFWEASWYRRGDGEFRTESTSTGNIGFLICTELWFSQRAREYARQGVHILACPRATPRSTAEKWLAGGRTAAVVSGAYCLSSNLAGTSPQGGDYAGMGWVIEPEEGEVLGLTSSDRPFVTIEINPAVAENAKRTYPRYVPD